jgi:transposase-like protein
MILNASPWKRCQFHSQQNAQPYVPKVSMRQQVDDDIRYIYNFRNRPEADMRLNEIVEKYSKSAPDLARWMESAIHKGLTIFGFPKNIRRRLRSSNMCETSTPKLKDASGSQASLQTKPPSYASSPPSSWTFPRSGSPAKPIFPRSVTTNQNQQKTFAILQSA